MKRVISEINIIASGNSLYNFDFESLKGKEIIAVNWSIGFIPFAQRVVGLDKNFQKALYKFEGWQRFLGEKATKKNFDKFIKNNPLNYNDRDMPGTIQIPKTNINNSGYAAVILGLELAEKVNLYGFDMYRDKYVHFYDTIPIAYTNHFPGTQIAIEKLDRERITVKTKSNLWTK